MGVSSRYASTEAAESQMQIGQFDRCKKLALWTPNTLLSSMKSPLSLQIGLMLIAFDLGAVLLEVYS